MKKVYVVLSKTGTWLSYLLQMYTKEPVPHCSFSLDKELYHMYSFGRRKPYDTFNVGFVHERPDKNVFGRFRNIRCEIYEVEVTNEQYRIMWNTTKSFWKNKESYKYNTIGIVLALFRFYPEIPDSYYCTQFVAYVLQKAGVAFTDKNYLEMRSEDFRNSPLLHRIYSGNLQEYWAQVKREE